MTRQPVIGATAHPEGGSPTVINTARDAAVVQIVFNEGLEPLFQRLYVDGAAALRRAGEDVHLLCVCPVGYWTRRTARRRWRTVLRSAHVALPGRVGWVLAPPRRSPGLWDPARGVARWIRRRVRQRRSVILDGQGTRATEIALRARDRLGRGLVSYRCWADDGSEAAYLAQARGEPDGGVRDEASAAQHQVLREADGIAYVSSVMADRLGASIRERRTPHVIAPCPVDVGEFETCSKDRSKARQALGLREGPVLGYVGSLHAWQWPTGLAPLLRGVFAADASSQLLCLVSNPQRMAEWVRASGIPETRVVIREAAADVVPRLLAAADAGLLVRDSHPMNLVASPIKFGEYLAAALPVVVTDGIGDCSQMVRREDLGVIVDLQAPESGARSIVGLLREPPEQRLARRGRCQSTARATFDVGVVAAAQLRLFTLMKAGRATRDARV